MRKVAINEIHKNTPVTNKLRTFTQKTKKRQIKRDIWKYWLLHGITYTENFHCAETIFSFFKSPEKMGFLKRLFGNIIFFVLLEKMIFLFPENMILPLRRKMKDDLSQKNTRKYDISFKCSEKMVLSKGTSPGHDLSCIIWKDVFFFWKHIFSLGGKREAIFFKKYIEIWNFLCTGTGVTNAAPCPLSKEIKDDLIPQKYTRRWLAF